MSKIVGIDLGTTNSLVATVDAGIPLVIADAEGRRLTPSVVHFPGAGLPPVVGHPANHVRAVNPSETVYSTKLFIGRRAAEIEPAERGVTYPLCSEGTGPVTMPIHGATHTPETVAAEVLKKLQRDATAYLGVEVTRAVITVPAYFNDAQRSATKRAGELAGFTVERILNGPTAAALAYGLDKLHERARIAVYDLGGGTFDLSILELHEGIFQVLATNGNTRLGGDDLDQRLMDFLIDQIRQAGGPDLTPSPCEIRDSASSLPMLARLREVAEQSKIKLSTASTVEVALPFLTPAFSFRYQLSRAELEDLTRDIIQRTRVHCLRSLADAKLKPQDLDQVLLVGGQTRMPLVRQCVAEWFGCAEFEEIRGHLRLGADYHRPPGPLLNTSQNPGEAVALGAAIQAEILAGGFTSMLLLDVTPLSLGIETFGGLMNVIIPRNSTIPLKAGEAFTTAVDHQSNMLIHVLQGERERAKDNWSLGQFTLDFERAPKGVARVGVQFEIDANGILQVLARDLKTGQQKILTLKSAVDVNDEAVQKMIEESVAHAFDDLHARRWIEAKLRAEATLAATQQGLAAWKHELAASALPPIEAALLAVETALQSPPSTHQTGAYPALEAAIKALDAATLPLADLMMDKAAEALLRQKGVLADER